MVLFMFIFVVCVERVMVIIRVYGLIKCSFVLGCGLVLCNCVNIFVIFFFCMGMGWCSVLSCVYLESCVG